MDNRSIFLYHRLAIKTRWGNGGMKVITRLVVCVQAWGAAVGKSAASRLRSDEELFVSELIGRPSKKNL